MLLFNNDGNITGAVIKRISIHLMLLFNAFIPVMLLVITYFNTSNVTIQPLLARIAASLFPISIHLMLLFNKSNESQKGILLHFNTSNVTIQLHSSLCFPHLLQYFNTSNVTIQLAKINLGNFRSIISIHLMLLFNHIVLIFQHLLLQISIHLMLLFNALLITALALLLSFQYI